MGGFFKPWQRKIGVVTLLMACALLAVWGQGQRNSRAKLPLFNVSDGDYGIISTPRRIVLVKDEIQHNMLPLFGTSGPAKLRVIKMAVRHWLVISPLTLLSAYLLLSKTQKPKSGATQISGSSP